jgi:hypothetical protein
MEPIGQILFAPSPYEEELNAANTGLVLGNEKFRKEVEQLTGQRQHHLKRGPKPKTIPHPKTEFLPQIFEQFGPGWCPAFWKQCRRYRRCLIIQVSDYLLNKAGSSMLAMMCTSPPQFKAFTAASLSIVASCRSN